MKITLASDLQCVFITSRTHIFIPHLIPHSDLGDMRIRFCLANTNSWEGFHSVILHLIIICLSSCTCLLPYNPLSTGMYIHQHPYIFISSEIHFVTCNLPGWACRVFNHELNMTDVIDEILSLLNVTRKIS